MLQLFVLVFFLLLGNDCEVGEEEEVPIRAVEDIDVVLMTLDNYAVSVAIVVAVAVAIAVAVAVVLPVVLWLDL